ncbi:CHAD domain-containing protein [Anatilimnocola floriformis]|uniref:CHAD domain-containing protein n=1 Tax=Anatilimnocola floriformis TaxID=2948575 RepID=UPI0020C4C8C4|nr:CHAD domain-containing protein [Anatilimnocola floriformis]
MSKPARIPAAAQADAAAPQLARKVVKQRVQAAVFYWERVAKRDKPRVEDVHQLRVWSRRSMAAVELFLPFFAAKPAAELLGMLNKARKRAGKARDCDVLLAKLDKRTREALAEHLETLKTGRAESAEKLQSAYRKKVRSGKVADCLADLQKESAAKNHSAKSNGHVPPQAQFGVWFLTQFAASSADFIQQLRPAKASLRRIHQLRIDGKHVRYALEIGLPALPKAAGKQLYASLEALQEQLGEICDDLAFAERFRELAAGLKEKQQARLEKEAARHDEQAQAGFEKFSRWWRAANGRKKLQRQFAAIFAPLADIKPRGSKPAQRRKSQ